MTEVQKWFDKKYPENERNSITDINISARKLGEEFLQGDLVVKGFRNLLSFNCSHHDWSGKQNSGITSLEFVDCPVLERVNCHYNKIEKLSLQNLSNLQDLNCRNNNLLVLNLSQNGKLKKLNFMNNNFQAPNLSFLSHLVEIESLKAGNSDSERINRRLYNSIGGSLGYLKNMKNLVTLDISNTDINTGLEELPSGVVSFSCRANVIEKARVNEIFSSLNSQQRIELDREGCIKDFPARLRIYKTKFLEGNRNEENKGHETLGDKLNDKNQEIQRLSDEIDQLKRDKNALSTKIVELEGELIDKKSELDKAGIRIKELEDKSQDSSNQTSQNVIDELNSKIKELESKNENLESERDKLEEELNDNKEAALEDQRGLLASNNSLKKEIENLKKQVESLQQESKIEIPSK